MYFHRLIWTSFAKVSSLKLFFLQREEIPGYRHAQTGKIHYRPILDKGGRKRREVQTIPAKELSISFSEHYTERGQQGTSPRQPYSEGREVNSERYTERGQQGTSPKQPYSKGRELGAIPSERNCHMIRRG